MERIIQGLVSASVTGLVAGPIVLVVAALRAYRYARVFHRATGARR